MSKKRVAEPADWRDYLVAKFSEWLLLVETLDRLRRAQELKSGAVRTRRSGLSIDPALAAATDAARAALETPEDLASRLTASSLAQTLSACESKVAELARGFWKHDGEPFTTRLKQLEALRLCRYYIIEKSLSERAAFAQVARDLGLHDATSVRRLLRSTKKAGPVRSPLKLVDAFVARLDEARRARIERDAGHK